MTLWAVEILIGPAIEPEEGIPVQFGTPATTVGDDGSLSPVGVNLTYDPVGLRIGDREAWLWVSREDGATRNFRWMQHVTDIEVDWTGALRIRGMEARADGALVTALWSAEHASEKMCDDCTRAALGLDP